MSVQEAVLEALKMRWMAGYEIRNYVHRKTGRICSESAISARIRGLRKPRFGGHPVTCRFVDSIDGKRRWEYGICE